MCRSLSWAAQCSGTRDAAACGIHDGQWVRVFNDRGGFRAKAIVGETVKAGVVVTLGI